MAKRSTKTTKLSVDHLSPKPAVKRLESPDAPTLYVNHVNLDLTNWDVRFRLGQVQEVNPATGVVIVKEVGTVYMSHAHAIAFAQALNLVISKLHQIQADQKGGEATGQTH